MARTAGEGGRAGGAALPLSGLLALIAGAVALALADPAPAPVKTAGTPRPGAGEALRDVLTGRPTDASGRPRPPAQGWGSPGRPLRVRFVPSGDRHQADLALTDLLAWLRRRTGLAVEGAVLRSYGLVVQELVQGQCDVAFLTAASYARAHHLTQATADPGDDLDAVLMAVREGSPEYPGSDLAYRGALFVRADSPIRSVADLRPEHVVAMGSRTSGAGSILPTALFNARGIAPRVLRLEGYPLIVTAVLQGSADVGCVYWSPPAPGRPENDGRRTVLESHPAVFEQTRLIGFTPWIPNEPVVIRRAVPAPLRDLLARAIPLYVIENARTPEGRARLESVGSVVGYLPASHADFDPLMEVIERAFLHDPEGRRDFLGAGR